MNAQAPYLPSRPTAAAALGLLLLACGSCSTEPGPDPPGDTNAVHARALRGPVPGPPTRPRSELEQLLAVARAEGSVRVVVQLRRGTRPPAELSEEDAKQQRQDIRTSQEYVLGRLQGHFREQQVTRFADLPFLSVRLTEQGLLALDDLATELEDAAGRTPRPPEAEHRFRYSGDVALREHRGPPAVRDLDTVREVIGWNELPASMSPGGVTIAVIDDGVDYTLPLFAAAPVAGAFYTSDSLAPCGDASEANSCRGEPELGLPLASSPLALGLCPDLSHGTQVALAACGLAGIAPEARLVVLRVEGADGTTLLSDVARALADLLDAWWDPYEVRVVSISLGSGELFGTASACSGEEAGTGGAAYAALAAACSAAEAAGLVVVVSAGNDDARGVLPSPACLEPTVTVAGTVDFASGGTVMLSGTTNWAEGVVVAAPSVKLSYPYDGLECALDGGTSLATPIVSGAVAILLHAFPDAKPADIRLALAASTYRVTSAWEMPGAQPPRVELTRPFLRIDDALEHLGNSD